MFVSNKILFWMFFVSFIFIGVLMENSGEALEYLIFGFKVRIFLLKKQVEIYFVNKLFLTVGKLLVIIQRISCLIELTFFGSRGDVRHKNIGHIRREDHVYILFCHFNPYIDSISLGCIFWINRPQYRINWINLNCFPLK